jgi:sugar lactone lactonase YvrE
VSPGALSVAAQTGAVPGEGPGWLADLGLFAWIDIRRRAWHRLQFDADEIATTLFDAPLTGFAPTAGAAYIRAYTDGIAFFDAQGRGPLFCTDQGPTSRAPVQ